MVYPTLSPLVLKQIFFLECFARFIFDLKTLGYGYSGGEMWRPPETAALYASEKRGKKNSLHIIRLAVDLNFFKDGALIRTPREVADLWESYSTPLYKCESGYYFSGDEGPDDDHFSVANGGME